MAGRGGLACPAECGVRIKMHFVYILKSKKDRGYYIGCTSDLRKRLKAHNSGKTTSLRCRLPLEIVYYERYDNIEDAYRREKQIKSYRGGEAFKKLLSKSGGVA